ncbi:hypothetical protein ES692_17400 [Psychroserpens burtonensis]|uniref:Uncharacterized protein n=1 Tax=Psychroserpens burtonensis TaxID=49278 RepID=A0A5C7B629_9FLAO|nr:hypothetical protein [Psychroserpens burtonensis]TXE15271.1 hypothetical protein ES692_17400 [Psychroserpens burtonensis]
MRKTIIFIFIISIFASCKDKSERTEIEQTVDSNFKRVYTGMIADKYPITMELELRRKSLMGTYKYDKSGIPIEIRGYIKEDSVFINGFDNLEEKIDKFKGTIKDDLITGIWSDPNDKNQQKFVLQEKNENLESEKEDNEPNYDDKNFPIVEFIDVGFYDSIPEFRGKGSSLKFTIKIKNNTPDDIRNFELNYFIKLIYKDQTFSYHPMSFFGNKNDDDKFKDIIDIMTYEIPSKTVWESNEIKTLELIVPESKLSGYNINFANSEFERTPLKAYIAYQYKATSIDGEYKNRELYDILEFWKNYQKKLGFRK